MAEKCEKFLLDSWSDNMSSSEEAKSRKEIEESEDYT